MENTRVTALLGAGVNLGLDLGFKPSTAYLTEKVVNAQYQIIDVDTYNHRYSDLVSFIYYTICANYSEGALDPVKSYNIVHFEILFHVLENLYSYTYLNEIRSLGGMLINNYVPPFAYFANIKLPYKTSEIKQVMQQYIAIIMDEINTYDDAYRNKKGNGINKSYCDFWGNAPFMWDVFTLNYDTTIENSLPSYEDGFADIDAKYQFKKFIPEKLLYSKDNTVNHVHGCITYGIERLNLEEYNNNFVFYYDSDDYYSWNNYGLARKLWHSYSRSNLFAQNHEVIFPSPIITGLNKTEKLTTLPYNIYKFNLSQKIMKNNALLIAGYSFGDMYINQEIERMRLYFENNWKVVIIDYWPLSNDPQLSEREKIDLYLHEHKFNRDFVHLVCKVAHETWLDSSIFDIVNPGQLVSMNKQLMLFVRGTNDALQYANDIYAFLQ